MYPPWVMMTSLEYTQMDASIMSRSVKALGKDDMHTWVTRDNWLMATLNHWFGENNFGKVGFMDGFLLQLNDEDMTLCFRDKKNKLNTHIDGNSNPTTYSKREQ
jgi:hypothetical protein